MNCLMCGHPCDPVAEPVHPCCEPTRDAAHIRSLHPTVFLKAPPKKRRLPRLTRHNPDLDETL
jgi:hypothetical protein